MGGVHGCAAQTLAEPYGRGSVVRFTEHRGYSHAAIRVEDGILSYRCVSGQSGHDRGAVISDTIIRCRIGRRLAAARRFDTGLELWRETGGPVTRNVVAPALRDGVKWAADRALRPINPPRWLPTCGRRRVYAVTRCMSRPATSCRHVEQTRTPMRRWGWPTGSPKLPADRDIVAYCRGTFCVIAPDAVHIAKSAGRTLKRLDEGMLELRLAGLPVAEPQPRAG